MSSKFLDDKGLQLFVERLKSYITAFVEGKGYTNNIGTITGVTASAPLSGGGSNGAVTVSHANSGATAGSYGDSAAQTPAYGGTFKVPYVTVNATGHVTAISEHTVKIPASDNTDTRVIQTAGTGNAAYPLLAASSASPASGSAAGAIYASGITINPSTNTITAAAFSGSLSGNAATATTLATARTINGTSFNGSGNITTSSWGTARTITIGNTGKSVNGSANVSWTLSEIGAAASSHTHSYLPLSGGTLTGKLTISSSGIQLPDNPGSWVSGMTSTSCIVAGTLTQSSYHPVLRITSYSGNVFNIGGLGDSVGIYGFKSGRTANGTDWSTAWNTSNGNITHTGSITASGGFSGNLTGSASQWGGYAVSKVSSLPSSPNASTVYLVTG